jgi:MFS superfamily sulfate permease-like transporter
VGVSGPAAGLAAIVLAAITSLGSFETFLLAVVLGGVIQLLFGIFKAGVIGYYFPSSVIRGMLTGIGLIIIIKQLPYFFGFTYNSIASSNELESSFLSQISMGSTIVAVISLTILLVWENILSKKS